MHYFTPDEFTRSSFCLPDETAFLAQIKSDPLSLFDPAALQMLDDTRRGAGIPFRLSCSFRSKRYDLQKGRSGNSSHTRGYAFDIRISSPRERFLVLEAAFACGWPRIGIADSFVHLDCDPSLTQLLVWTY